MIKCKKCNSPILDRHQLLSKAFKLRGARGFCNECVINILNEPIKLQTERNDRSEQLKAISLRLLKSQMR